MMNESKAGSVIFGAIAVLVVFCGLLAMGHPGVPGVDDGYFDPTGSGFLSFAAVGVFGTTWLGMVPALRGRG